MKSYKRLILLYMLMSVLSMSACSEGKENSAKTENNFAAESNAEVQGEDGNNEDEQGDDGSPEKEHTVSQTVLEAQVDFDKQSGFYDDSISLELSCEDSSLKIYYTTDGSVPTTDDIPYEGVLTLDNRSSEENVLANMHDTTNIGFTPGYTLDEFFPVGKVDKANIIRAAAFNDKGERGPVSSHTYFVGINREQKYGDVPVISLMVDQYDLFDHDTGIYTLGAVFEEWIKDPENAQKQGWETVANYTQKGRDWERPVFAEYIAADGSVGFAQDMGIRIMGAASRNDKQKSLRLIARADYSQKNVKYEVIPDNERSDKQGNVEKYKAFVLRNGGNDNTKVRDPYLQESVADRDFETQQSMPAVVYLDGEFWGMYVLQEDYDAKYIQNNYGIDDNNVVMVKIGEIEEGEEADMKLYSDMYEFITQNDMTAPDNYAKVGEMLDIRSFVDYCAFNVYINNEDGIFENNNWRMWRVRETDPSNEYADGLWRMMVYDTEYSTGLYVGGQNYRDNTIKKALNKNNQQNKETSQPAADMFRALMENETFKQDFVTTLCDLRNINFEKDHAKELINEVSGRCKKLTNATYKRFGPVYANFDDSIAGLEDFMTNKYDYIMKNIDDAFSLGETAAVTVMTDDASKGTAIINASKLDLTEDFQGDYYTCYPITLTAVPESGHKFVRWECTNCEIEDDTAEVITVNFDKDVEIKAVFE